MARSFPWDAIVQVVVLRASHRASTLRVVPHHARLSALALALSSAVVVLLAVWPTVWLKAHAIVKRQKAAPRFLAEVSHLKGLNTLSLPLRTCPHMLVLLLEPV